MKWIPVAADQGHCPRCEKELPVIGYERSEGSDMDPVKYFVLQLREERRAASWGCVRGVGVATSFPFLPPMDPIFGDKVTPLRPSVARG